MVRFWTGLIVGALLVLVPVGLALMVSLSQPALTEPTIPELVFIGPATSMPSTQPTTTQPIP
jgi:hypothetical protein